MTNPFSKRARLVRRMEQACQDIAAARRYIGDTLNEVGHCSRQIEAIDTAETVGSFFDQYQPARSGRGEFAKWEMS